jgi:hypothetical protein
MKLTDQEKRELLADGKSKKRRKQFKADLPASFATFEAYLAALDDLLAAGPAHSPRPFIRYTDVRL